MDSGKKGLGEIALYAVLAAVFYRSAFSWLIFVIPLTVLYRRRGFKPGFWVRPRLSRASPG
jgi:hypothetical protein